MVAHVLMLLVSESGMGYGDGRSEASHQQHALGESAQANNVRAGAQASVDMRTFSLSLSLSLAFSIVACVLCVVHVILFSNESV